jgi:hypothetical protein
MSTVLVLAKMQAKVTHWILINKVTVLGLLFAYSEAEIVGSNPTQGMDV